MIESNEVQIGTNFSRVMYMLAFAPKHEIINFVKSQCVLDDQTNLENTLQKWESLQPLVRQIVQNETSIFDNVMMKRIPAEYHEMLHQVASHVLFQNSFSFSPTEFAIVEIDKLVAGQRTVNIDHVNSLIEQWSSPLEFSDLLNICLSPEGNRAPIQHLQIGQNAHIFSSPDSDLRTLGTYMKKITPEDYGFSKGGHPVAAIVSLVGYGSAPVNVLNGGNRLVLNNGFHRVYALRSLGVKEIPVVVQNFENIELEFPSRVVGLPKDYVLNFPRPVVMGDFFDPKMMTEFKIKKRLRAVQMSSSGNEFDIAS